MSVNSYLTNIASLLIITNNERDIIDNHINTLKDKLYYYFPSNSISEKFPFGSYTRKTLMPRKADNQSDVDYMVVFTDGQYRPVTYLNWLRKFAEERYPRSEIYKSHPTIVLELSKIIIELVPSIKTTWGDNYQIPAPASDYNDWLVTHPNDFNSKVSAKNTNEKKLIRPLIRLLKYWNAKNEYVYSSFELENLIVNHLFYFCENLRDYLYSFVSGLSTFNKGINKERKINNLKNICIEAKRLESNGYHTLAEIEIKKAIPEY